MKRRYAFCRLLPYLGISAFLWASPSLADTDNYSTGPGQGGPDSICDVWQAIYNAWGLAASDDEDNDGCSNLVESIAGTDPRNPDDCLRVGTVALTPGSVVFTFDAEAGKKYRILSADDPGGPYLTVVVQDFPVGGETEYIPAADNPGEIISGVRPSALIRKFYKLEASDVDTDEDGVSDWAELSTGLNPMLKDSDGDGTEDGDVIEAEVSVPNIVTIESTTTLASEDGPQSGMFTVRRTRSLVGATVNYSIAGTAVSPTDFSASPTTSVTFSPGEKTQQIHVNPLADIEVEGSESVTATLTTASAGEFADPVIDADNDEATVIIQNSTAPTGTGLTARYYDTASANYSNAANFNTAQLKIDRVDPVVDNDWGYGTPNGAGFPAAGPGENYSVRWTGYLEPNAAGVHTFRLLTEGDDQARVLLDADGAGPGGLVQILENGWDSPSTGGYKTSAGFTFAVPPGPADRYQIRVEFIETTGSATCRFQWDPPNAGFQNIPSARVYRNNTGTGVANQRYEAIYYDGTNQDFSLNVEKGTRFDTAVTNGNNGIWGVGSPDASMDRNNFSIRWTGQVQPQFSEEYTFSVHADNGCRMWINGEELTFRTATQGNVGGSTYAYDSVSGDAVITYSNSAIVADSFAVGDVIRIDPTTGSLSSLATLPYTVTAATTDTFTVNFGAGAFSTGTGNMNIDSLNRELKPWATSGAERFARVSLVGGVRYDLQLDYFETGGYARCRLFWLSPSQPNQIIPASRLYPEIGVTHAPPAHISDVDATALAGGLFSYAVQGSNGASVSLSGNPAWLNFSGGVLSGTPTAGDAGDYQIVITLTNADGTSTSVLNLRVEDTGGSIVREYWNGVAGTSVADIPTGTAPTGTSNLTSLEAPTDFGDDYGTRVSGYITAPETGNYYFWIAGSNAAEIWISNDDEPVNAFKRAWVNAGSATPQAWNVEPNQRSAWLALEQGQRYYIEILHKAGVGAGDNLAVGWAKPGESDAAPSEVVPSYVLSPYVEPAPGSTPGTLYVATMLSQGGAVTNGVGSSTLRLSEDESFAIMTRSYANLTGPITSEHIHVDPYQTFPSTIVFDIDDPGVEQTNLGGGIQPDGSYKWFILPVGALTKPDIIEIIKQGKAYINLHTAAYPAGEIRGNYTLANGSRTFTPPPPPPVLADDHDTDVGAVRFLQQATFGPNIADVAALKAMPSYEAWIDDQFTKPASLHLPEVYRAEFANAQGGALDETLSFNAWWYRSITGDDQLRQRIAFALSQIHVVSAQGPLNNRAQALSYFYDQLAENAFGNFRDILVDTTLTPTMGRYLDMLRNDKPDLALGRIPNENYAREIKQLFSVGLFRMWPDGTLMLTSKDSPIDTYSQREIVGFSHVFTGWDYGYDGPDRTALNAPQEWTRPMRVTPARHFTGRKRLLNNEVLPGLTSVNGQPLDPYAFHNVMYFDDSAYRALPDEELAVAHDQLFNHPNVGPFICRQLIQRLVTSHPSRDYLYRVVSKFNDNGFGVRGDMKAVIKAILLDYEARSDTEIGKPAFGKQREPLLRVATAGRAFRPETFTGTYTQTDTVQNTSHQIFITTDTPHGLANGNQVFLEFEDTTGDPNKPAPFIGAYSVQSSSTNSFRVTDKSWAFSSGSGYSIPANSTTCTATMNNPWLEVGHQVYMDFRSGPAAGDAGLDNAVYTITSTTGQTGSNRNLTFEIPPGEVSGSARTGAFMIRRFTPGSYTARASGLPYPNDRRVTMDTNFDHHLKVGDVVQLNYTAGNPLPADAVVVVDTVEDLNTWTYLTNSDQATGFATNENNNGVYQFPLGPPPQVRNGTVGSRPSTFNMRNTDNDLDQSPLNAPTVFNYFLPDFKNPGALASQGITTPEFQTTAETTVIRQANFLYNGLFNPGSTNGYSSFINGNNSLVLDLSPWMDDDASDVGLGAPNNTTLPWMHNQNLDTLIDQLSTLLTADQLSAAAKTIIRNFVALEITAVGTGNPCPVTTAAPHGFQTGDVVHISDVSGGTINPTMDNTSNTRTITVTSPTTFTVTGVNCTAVPTNLSNATVSQVVYNQGDNTPTAAHKRDRLRAIIHLILTSADFTIQR